jgi:outer membrane protein TolC
MLDAARRMAANIPAQLSAARQADAQARARYEAGLTGILEVADAQRLLAQAESEAALASLAVWRARLAVASASGDLTSFVAETAALTTPIKP